MYLSCAVQLDKQFHLSLKIPKSFLTHHKSWNLKIIIVRNPEKGILHEFMVNLIIIFKSYHITQFLSSFRTFYCNKYNFRHIESIELARRMYCIFEEIDKCIIHYSHDLLI